MINTEKSGFDGLSPEHRVRLRFFLEGQNEEVMPIVQYGGITLIRQNIGIKCESQNPDFIEARGEVNELEGFFCVMRYIDDADLRAMPKYVKILVSAVGFSENSRVLYSERITEFDVQLVSEIKVETNEKDYPYIRRDPNFITLSTTFRAACFR